MLSVIKGLRFENRNVIIVLVACFSLYVILDQYNSHLDIRTVPKVVRSLSTWIHAPSKNRILNEGSPNPIENYYRYPCIKELDFDITKPCVRTVCREPSCVHYVNCTALPLKVINNTTICTHNITEDLIAKFIKRDGAWEDPLVKNMINILNENPDMMLVDIGCNIGVFTLVAAWMSRHVLCVDANYENTHLIHTSLALANLTENVTFVWNGLSSERKLMQLKLFKRNIGASRFDVNPGDTSLKEITVQSILLDELEPLVRGKQVFMKMDVENHEYNVIQGGLQFFKTVDVRYIQIEFGHPPEIKSNIMKILAGYGFLLFVDHGGIHRISLSKVSSSGDGDRYFIKNSQLLKH